MIKYYQYNIIGQDQVLWVTPVNGQIPICGQVNRAYAYATTETISSVSISGRVNQKL